jgi:hypothetical protein
MSTNKNIEPLSQYQIKNNIFFLGLMKNQWFHDDHPGIDSMIKDMEKQLEDPEKSEKSEGK